MPVYSENERWIIKYRSLKKADGWIAAKLGLTETDVRRLWEGIAAGADENAKDPGTGALLLQYQTLILQYQLLGDSIKTIALALDNQMTLEELRTLLSSDPEETLTNLSRECIILRPFVPPNQKELADDAIRK